MSKKFSLPKKVSVAKEATEASWNPNPNNPTASASGAEQNLMPAAFPLDTTNLREDFIRQAEALKEKIVLGSTPVRVEKPKNTYSLKADGTLKGDMKLIEQDDKGTTIDLTSNAKAVNEGIKRPVFKRKSREASETVSNDLNEDSTCIYNDRVDCPEGQSCTTCPERPSNKEEADVFQVPEEKPVGATEGFAFGEEAANKYGKLIQEKLSGKLISKRKDKANRKGGLSYEADKLGIDMWDLLEALEGMCRTGQAKEVDDSTYEVLPLSTSDAIIKDERESADKQPKEAVACESRFPAFNEREKRFLNSKDEAGVRAAMADGTLSKVRGKQILFTMGAREATEEIVIPKATDKGVPVEPISEAPAATEATKVFEIPPQLAKKLAAADGKSAPEDLEGIIDTEIGDELDCDVVYTSRKPLVGQVTKLSKDKAKEVADAFESLGIKTRTLSAKEEYSVLFTQEEEVSTTKWYALVVNKTDSSRVSQLTLTTNATATENEVREYLYGVYGKEGVLQVSSSKIV